MSLLTLGRTATTRDMAGDSSALTPEQQAEVKRQVEAARKSLIGSMAPWIPGDFLVTYGALLTAWTSLRASFPWMVLLAVGLAFALVFGAAFSETGFKDPKDRVYKRLIIRSLVGAFAAVYACFAVPNSGWYDFAWFVDNELAVITTAGIGATLIVLLLKGIERSSGMLLQP